MTYQLAYDPEDKSKTGYFGHNCGSRYYGGGLYHMPDCPPESQQTGYSYFFGPQVVEQTKLGRRNFYDLLDMEQLRRDFPQLVN